MEVLQNKITDEASTQKKSAKLLALESKLESKLKKIDKEVTFYEQNDNCPTCKQHIDDTFRSGELDRNNQAKGEVRTGLAEIQKQFEETSKRIQEIDKIIKHVQSHNNEVIKQLGVQNKPNKTTRVDPNRQNYIENDYSLSPVVLDTPKEPVRIVDGKFSIGGL